MLTGGNILSAISCVVIVMLLLPPAKSMWEQVPILSKSLARGISLIILLVVAGVNMEKPNEEKTKVTLTQPKQEKPNEIQVNEVVQVKPKSKVIPGLAPVDVYGNFENKGFTIDEKIGAKTASWTCFQQEDGIEYTAEVYATDNVGKVNSVEYTALRTTPERNSVEAMKAFLKYGASLPYDAADPSKVAQFIEDNYYTNESSVVVNGVKFTLYVPSDYSRILSVEPE